MNPGLSNNGVAMSEGGSAVSNTGIDCACCGGGGPPPSGCQCPNGDFRAVFGCMTSYTATRTTVLESSYTPYACPPTGSTVNTYTITTDESWEIRGGPYFIPTDPNGLTAAGRFPVRYTRTVRYRGTSPQDFCPSGAPFPPDTHTEEFLCFGVTGQCADPPITGTDLTTMPIGNLCEVPFTLFAPGTSHVQGQQVRCTPPSGPPIPVGFQTTDIQTISSYTVGIGPNVASYRRTIISRTPAGTLPNGTIVGTAYGCFANGQGYAGASTETTTITADWSFTLAYSHDCLGNPLPPPCAAISDCTPPTQTWIRGEPCGGVGQPVFVLADNVQACGYLLYEGVCYKFSPSGSRVTSLPANARTSDVVITSAFTQSCCECSPTCVKSDLTVARDCWMNARRVGGVLKNSRDNPELVSPPFINGLCCCRPDDVFTIVFIRSRLRMLDNPQYGISQNWDLQPGQGLGLSFRRDEVLPLGDEVLTGQFISDVQVLDEFENVITTAHQFWGPCRNEPPMPCEWTTLMQAYFDFNRPHEAVGFYNNALGPFGSPPASRLPCPGDGDVFINGFHLEYWNISVTCGLFVLDAQWSHEFGGTLTNQMRITVNRPGGVGDPCSGGCSGQSPIPLLRSAPLSAATGCATCGQQGL